MPQRIQVRELTSQEQNQIQRLSHSRTEAARAVERAQVVALSSQGRTVQHSAAQLQVGAKLVRRWITRFNTDGLMGLADQPRSGRPPTYTPEEVGRVVATALTNPQDLGQPFGSWTCERLTRYLNEVCQIPIQHSRVHEILQEEGLRWREQETWFGARVDPAFAEKRGPSKLSISSPPRGVS